MRTWNRNTRQAGDTVVEVLIAILIISSVLVGAFLVAQKSTKAVRSSQEHSEMLQVLQGQVELVRTLALTQLASGPIFNTSSKYFCINGQNPASPQIVPLPGLGSALPAVESADFSKYTGACASIQNFYNVAITYTPGTHVFTFNGRWERAGGGGNNEEQLVYRIYPAKP